MSNSNFCSQCGGRIKDDTRQVRLVMVIACKHEGSFPDNQYPDFVTDEYCPRCYHPDSGGGATCPVCGRECEIHW